METAKQLFAWHTAKFNRVTSTLSQKLTTDSAKALERSARGERDYFQINMLTESQSKTAVFQERE